MSSGCSGLRIVFDWGVGSGTSDPQRSSGPATTATLERTEADVSFVDPKVRLSTFSHRLRSQADLLLGGHQESRTRTTAQSVHGSRRTGTGVQRLSTSERVERICSTNESELLLLLKLFRLLGKLLTTSPTLASCVCQKTWVRPSNHSHLRLALLTLLFSSLSSW